MGLSLKILIDNQMFIFKLNLNLFLNFNLG